MLQQNDCFKQIEAELVKVEPNTGKELFGKYAKVLSEEYCNAYTAKEVARDILLINELSAINPYAVEISQGVAERSGMWQLKLFKLNSKDSLSKVLPIVENFGMQLIDEQLKKLTLSNNSVLYVCDFTVQIDEKWNQQLFNADVCSLLKQALVGVFNEQIESDSLNKLVIRCGINHQQIAFLRAIAHYIVQAGLPFSRETIKDCLTIYPAIVSTLCIMFNTKFGSNELQGEQVEQIKADLFEKLLEVANLNDDHILRAYVTVIDAMVRTNYYQIDATGCSKPYISFKLISTKLDFLPKPKPLYEIFVYSKHFEGVHLRGGKVARGGIRWSDRKEDFRTEILGLVKAQIVKNSVIVPTGSKGGFICKSLPVNSTRQVYLDEGIACYKAFISGLLDITDNLVKNQVVPPENVVRYDEDDPYLVVAADKGTATFSDFANDISIQRGFWLGDAFASGGSAGYDHKKMAITALGAWESAKRHFRHLGKNIQKQEFSVVGIGDMSGDVFGNGMLLSRYIKLVAAFNHQHIFLDPNPDLEIAYQERKRLFELTTSGWDNYDTSKISVGGGVFSRTLKSIRLSNEVKSWLKLDVDELSPNDLIRTILTAQFDLLYNGGIGTYIKASSETHEQVKDKANDLLRINGCDLNAKVIVEGGNLGVTQLGRVEFATKGGRIFTDAIDNSAGVDCSDHEVNIKILFADIMQHSSMTVEERNHILQSMTDEVAELVLSDNYLQTQILSYAAKRSKELFVADMNFIDKLEKSGHLDRAVEFLPTANEVSSRKLDGVGLATPELSVLLAYSKIDIKNKILNSDLINDETFDELLIEYFPHRLQHDYVSFIKKHYLKKEIIANQLANLIVNRMGITFVSRFEDELRVSISQIVRAFWAAYKLLNMDNILARVAHLDETVSADVQVYILIKLKKSLERLTRWILRNIRSQVAVVKLLADYKLPIEQLLSNISTILPATDYLKTEALDVWLIDNQVPEDFARFITRSNTYPQLLDIAMIAKETNHQLLAVANNYFYAGRVLRFDWLRKCLIALPEHNKWQALSRSALLADGYKLYSTLVRKAIKYATSSADERFVSNWIANDVECVQQINTMFDELQTYKTLDLAMLSAVVRELTVMFSH